MNRIFPCGLIAGLLLASPVLARESESAAPFSLRGYGSLGMVYHDTAGVQYRRDISQAATGAKAGEVSTDQDSMLALQADYRGQTGFGGTLQVVSRQNAENNYAPQVTMANLQYRAGDGRIQLGRQLIEAYLEGDAAEIGYANTQVRQATIHYPRVIDGMGAEVSYPLGQGLLRFNGQAGSAVGKVKSSGSVYDAGGAEVLEGGIIYHYGAWQGRLSAGQLIFKNETPDMLSGGSFAVILPMLPNGNLLRDKFSMQGRRISHRMLELAYDSGDLRMQTGYSNFRQSHVPLQQVYALRAAYRSGELTPYVSYAKRWAARDFVGTGLADGLSAQIDALNRAILQAETAVICNQSELALGVRYDFMQDVALKLQWDRIRFQDSQTLVVTSGATSSPVTRGFKTMDLYSVVLDFQF